METFENQRKEMEISGKFKDAGILVKKIQSLEMRLKQALL
jgi:hypothetical protein